MMKTAIFTSVTLPSKFTHALSTVLVTTRYTSRTACFVTIFSKLSFYTTIADSGVFGTTNGTVYATSFGAV